MRTWYVVHISGRPCVEWGLQCTLDCYNTGSHHVVHLPAVRGALVLEAGELRWPAPAPPAPAPPPTPAANSSSSAGGKHGAKDDKPSDLYPVTLKNALVTTGVDTVRAHAQHEGRA